MDGEVVNLSVAFIRREAKQILRVQFVRDFRKGGREILTETNLRVAAARFFSDSRQARIRQVGHQHRLESARTDSWRRRTRAPAAHTDCKDHHVFATSTLDDFRLADGTLTETDRSRVFAVAEHQDDGTLV